MNLGSVCLLRLSCLASAWQLAWWWIGVPAAAQGPIQLSNVTSQTGISFRHSDGSSGRHYLVEAMASGLATFDYDGDDLIDVYFVTGGRLPGTKPEGLPPQNALYRNLGHFRFLDVTERAGVKGAGFGLGVAAGDYDNDGHPDLYLSNFGPNVLYRNRGNGTFEDVTSRAGVGRGNKVGAGVAFLDFDGDGNLDLFAANYIRFSFEMHKLITYKGIPVYPGPLYYHGEPAELFRNRGDGTFADVGAASGIAAHAATGMGVICADYDGDGRTDIFVANDEMPNYLFHNDGRGKFEEVGLAAGVAYDSLGVAHGNMGVDAADCHHQGRLDFAVTAYQREPTTLYRNAGQGLFTDVTAAAGTGKPAFNQVKWGVGLVDFDNDGYRDLFVACGHLDDNVELCDDTTSYRARNVLLRNTGDGRFLDVSAACGDGLAMKRVGRGVAFDDLDNNGRVDVVILNSRSEPTVLRNESSPVNHWLQLRLRGIKTNRDGVGAQVRVVAGDLVQVDEVHSGRGYQSHWGTRLHFGLGKHPRVDRIEVRWIGGGVDVIENVSADRRLTIAEGTSEAIDLPPVIQ
jgi:enediyne biosynthesis protein E4